MTSTEPRLAQRIVDAISSGAYRPGEWLKQIDLAETFSVTRFEVRKALDELTLRKAVVHVPEKGYRVNEPSSADIRESRVVRAILETGAARLVVVNIDDAGIAALERLAADFWRTVEVGSPSERNTVNHLFHDRMYAFAGNSILADMIREVRDRMRGSPIYHWPTVQSMRQSAKDHDDIIAALKRRDTEGVVEAVRRHILKDLI